MKLSIRWKIVIIYSLVFLLAAEIMGVYIYQALEGYYLQDYVHQLQSQGELLAGYSEQYLLKGKDDSLDSLVETFSRSARAEITLLDAYGRVVASSVSLPALQQNRLIQEEVTRVLMGNPVSRVNTNSQSGQRYQLVAIPVTSRGQVIGALYITGSLEQIYQTLEGIQWIIITGGLVVMLVALFLSIILSRTITEPIQAVTNEAAKMAKGEFSPIDIGADDEIGRLAQAFNYMASQLEKNLREISTEKGKVEAILNQMSDGLVAMDTEGTILHINPAAQKMLGLPPEKDQVGRKGQEVLAPVLNAEDLLPCLDGSISLDKEVSPAFSSSQGNRVLKFESAPFHPPQGELSGVLLLIHDVTQEREMVRLQQEFVANVSHELRTPLTTLKSYIETLLEGAKEDPATRDNFLQVAYRETERMVRLVRNLLKLSRFDFKQVNWKFSWENLEELSQEVVEEFEMIWGGERQFEVDCPDALFYYLDRDRIKQVLVNLLNNAVNYTANGGRIKVEVCPVKGGVEVAVIDDGIGIPTEDLPRVLERFYRVDKTRSRQRGGTGLGLAIAKEIVEGHRGRIWVDSKPGEGTAVRFFLPSTKGGERNGRED